MQLEVEITAESVLRVPVSVPLTTGSDSDSIHHKLLTLIPCQKHHFSQQQFLRANLADLVLVGQVT